MENLELNTLINNTCNYFIEIDREDLDVQNDMNDFISFQKEVIGKTVKYYRESIDTDIDGNAVGMIKISFHYGIDLIFSIRKQFKDFFLNSYIYKDVVAGESFYRLNVRGNIETLRELIPKLEEFLFNHLEKVMIPTKKKEIEDQIIPYNTKVEKFRIDFFKIYNDFYTSVKDYFSDAKLNERKVFSTELFHTKFYDMGIDVGFTIEDQIYDIIGREFHEKGFNYNIQLVEASPIDNKFSLTFY